MLGGAEGHLVVWFLDSDQVLDKDMFVVLVRCLIRGAAASGANTVAEGTMFAPVVSRPGIACFFCVQPRHEKTATSGW